MELLLSPLLAQMLTKQCYTSYLFAFLKKKFFQKNYSYIFGPPLPFLKIQWYTIPVQGNIKFFL